ncbi:hypothetical protein [Pseudomonas fulva]|uniref:hypothetical protein n=1 Tax=Pseudomonas fulva TaxID=47880 RepID=UPI0032EFC6A1
MKQVWITIILTAALAGCAVQPPVQRVPFPTAEYDALPKTGTGTVTGQAFLRTVGGEVKYGAGSDVYLQPVTAYTTQWYEVNVLGGRQLASPDPRANQGQLSTQADGSGNFSFTNVPPGKYYLSAAIRWSAPSQYGLLPQGGVIVKTIAVSDGNQTTQMLTQ